MQKEKWKSILDNVKDKFDVEDEGVIHSDEYGGVDIEHIVFTGPLGKIKLEFVTKPVVLDKKTTYSNRIGSETKVDYIYSQDEKVEKLRVYKWNKDENDWQEIDGRSFGA